MQPGSSRYALLQQLCFDAYPAITEHALTDPRLTPADAHDVFTGLVRHLEAYSGPVEESSFLDWALGSTATAVTFYGIRNECRGHVVGGIGSVLRTATDLGIDSITEAALESDVWTWVLEHLAELQVPGKSKLTTRLYSAARFKARAWKTDQLRRRERFGTERVDVAVQIDGSFQQTVPAHIAHEDDELAGALNH